MGKENSETLGLHRQLPKIESIQPVLRLRSVEYGLYVLSFRLCKINGVSYTTFDYRLYRIKDLAIEKGYISKEDFVPCISEKYKVLMFPVKLLDKVIECAIDNYGRSLNDKMLSDIIFYAKEHDSEIPDNTIHENDIEMARAIGETIAAINTRNRVEKREEEREIGEDAKLRDLVSRIENMGWNVSLSLKE